MGGAVARSPILTQLGNIGKVTTLVLVGVPENFLAWSVNLTCEAKLDVLDPLRSGNLQVLVHSLLQRSQGLSGLSQGRLKEALVSFEAWADSGAPTPEKHDENAHFHLQRRWRSHL